jgi:hypothetical protein
VMGVPSAAMSLMFRSSPLYQRNAFRAIAGLRAGEASM